MNGGLDNLRGLIADLPVPMSDGRFISQRVAMVVEVLQDIDKNIEVRWIPPEDRVLESDPAFAIVDVHPGHPENVIFYIQKEEDMDGRVVERFLDIKRKNENGTLVSEMETKNEAFKLLQQKLFKEQLDEANDLAYSILKSPLHRYKHDGVIYE
jgi:hypothetical protein